ncbi:MAG: hypothetical protein Q8L72_03740 [Moraxellaceae bacterium]|nr:hypothetical protein [Moraxellaceae bacterium]
MSYVFAFPLAADLQTKIDNMLSGHAKGEYVDAKVSTDLAIGTTDGVTKALALDVIEILKSNGEGAGLLGVLANLLKSTMHVLIRQIMGKVDHSEQDKLANYLKNRRIEVDGAPRFGFVMPEALGGRFDELLTRIADGNMNNARPDITKAMQDFVMVAVASFYDEFTSCIDLGFVKRKMVDVGRGTIIKGSQSTVNKLFATMSDDDLKKVTAHYTTMFVKQ